MIESIEFRNFKALRHTTLSLGRFTLLVGPNGSGKSTAVEALRFAGAPGNLKFDRIATCGLEAGATAEIILRWGHPYENFTTKTTWTRNQATGPQGLDARGNAVPAPKAAPVHQKLSQMRLYSLHAKSIAQAVQLQPQPELNEDGGNLTAVLDRVRDQAPERFDALSHELGRWLPEFDRILFDTPLPGVRALLLRTREGHHAIRGVDLSQGTLLALALLTIAYLPEPPPVVCLEEPDRGIHPRLLRDVRDAIYRLTHPEQFGDSREPVQVIATTHSPYMLDLFREHPEEIVIAKKVGLEATFERLTDQPHYEEIIEDAHLGDLWYSGVLGGVPADK